MQHPQDAEKVIVIVCPASEFNDIDEIDAHPLQWPLANLKNLGEIRRELIIDILRLPPAEIGVDFHPPDNCGSLVLTRHPTLDTYSDRDESGNPIIFAHIGPDGIKVSGLPRSATNAPVSASGSNATSAPQSQSSLAVGDGRSSKTDAISTNPAAKKLQYIRIGTQECEKDERPKAVQREVFLVANIPREENRADSDNAFLEVDTWTIGGVRIGRCEDGREFDIAKMASSYHLDPAFLSIPNKDITPFLYDIADGLVDHKFVNSFSTKVKKRSAEDSKPVELISAPEIPTYAANDATPAIAQPYRLKSLVSIVVDFKNKISIQSLGLPENFQANLEYNETYIHLENLLLKGDSGFEGGLENNRTLSNIENGFQLEVWVLPHVRGSLVMYNWTRLCNWETRDWSDYEVVRSFGRNLYIEVHIVPAKDTGPRELVEMMLDAERLLNVIEEVPEEGEEIVVKTNTKTKSKEHAVEDDLDEDEVERAGVEATDGSKRKKGNGRQA